jgi:WXG100 family type VII secretion target
MGVIDGLLPPPGAPGAVRAGASCWRATAERLQETCDRLRGRSAVLSASWHGPARSSFDEQFGRFVDAVQGGCGLLRQYADALDGLAEGIQRAQDEYHQRVAAVAGTVVVGALLTVATATLSDEAAAGLVAVELATATEVAATAAEQALAVLASLGAQAAALAARWAVLTGVAVGVDGASGMVVHRDLDPLAHVHWADDAEFAFVGALAVPIGTAFVGGAAAVADGALTAGLPGVATRLALGGAAMAGADAAVRTALGQGVDPGELAMAAVPLGRAGRRRSVVPPEGTIPLGFADAEEFAAFGRQLREGLADAGYGDAVPVFQGSAVTGVKYTTGEPFDVGRRSDFDLAIVDEKLFARLAATGVRIRRNPERTGPLQEDALTSAGLLALRTALSQRADRKVAFMIYRDLGSALDRAGGIVVR